ncbi:protein translocase subunit SecF [Candidatus Epulonipiscium viviparus]|uniref:protein translocase subunit SecF n=1 Tax=Candidatus Epulonipiscium viviparus TaxID=420336 RepID=UPI000497BA20|nr:protein translocase subunit SecF [Candidatus Epulopiscium viviparus]
MNYIQNRKIFFSISLILIAICFAAMGINYVSGRGLLNYDIEFSGGSILHLDLMTDFNVETEIMPLVIEYLGDDSAVIQLVPDTHQIMITTKTTDATMRTEFVKQVQKELNLTENIILAEDSVSPTISTELQANAMYAIVLGSILMLIYIWVRFKDFKFGAAAVVALVHDVLIMLFVYAVFRVPINNSFIAAILTIIGYSINDTIIVFDRIRENRRVIGGSDEEVINKSISQTLTRSINTSITTLIMVALLNICGTASVREFAFPLVIGVISGTYSSIFIASPVWFEMRKIAKRMRKKATT